MVLVPVVEQVAERNPVEPSVGYGKQSVSLAPGGLAVETKPTLDSGGADARLFENVSRSLARGVRILHHQWQDRLPERLVRRVDVVLLHDLPEHLGRHAAEFLPEPAELRSLTARKIFEEARDPRDARGRSEEHTSELQS